MFTIWFSVPYTLQEDVESDGNQLSYGDLVCNTIYTSTGWHKSHFYVEPYIFLKSVSMNTVPIKDIDVKVWTRKSDLTQGNLLHSLTQPGITRQRPFKLTEIKYYPIKYEIARMERVDYNTYFGRNVMNVDDIEDFANL